MSAGGNRTTSSGIAVRPEVVHLRAVGLVVVDDHHHRQPQPRDGLQLADAHQRAAVAERGYRQPVRPGDRGPDRRGQAEPDRLERLREAEARLVGNGQEHARVAHEVTRIDRHGPLRGQQVVQRDGQRARVDPLPVALVRVRHVPPASLAGDPGPHLRRPVPASAPGDPPSASATARAVSATSPGTPRCTGRCVPIAAGSSSTWTSVACGGISLPCRVVHMFSEQPQPTMTSASPISSAASGVANPPLTSRFHGLPRNRPLATAEVASSAPHASASRSSSAARPRAPRPAMNTGRRAPRSTSASAVTASAAGAVG